MATTVTALRTDRVTCLLCEDVIPSLIAIHLGELSYCRSCAHEVMRTDIVEMARELAS